MQREDTTLAERLEEVLRTRSGQDRWSAIARLLDLPRCERASAVASWIGSSRTDLQGGGEAARGDALLRRELLKLLGASALTAGFGACARQPIDKILPSDVRPRDLTPGIPSTYATAMTLDGFATGILAVSHDGRPTKIEGNPEHPASLGAAGRYEQA